MVGTKGHRGKTPQPDRGRVTERAIDGEAGRLAGEAARDLGNAARAFAFHTLAPLLSPTAGPRSWPWARKATPSR